MTIVRTLSAAAVVLGLLGLWLRFSRSPLPQTAAAPLPLRTAGQAATAPSGATAAPRYQAMKTLALLLALALQQPQTIRINYVNADLGDVIRSLATVLGVNVVLTDVPSRRITFQTPEPVPAPQVGAVLEAILESQGLVIVQTGPVAQAMGHEKRRSTR